MKLAKDKPPPKKRGRKPKGGAIITEIKKNSKENIKTIENIILHLKCNKSDLNDNFNNNLINCNYNVNENNFLCNKNNFENNNQNNNQKNNVDKKSVWTKLKKLAFYLNTNDVSDKRSACFWCTFDFDNPSIYIPKCEINGTYQCYGCFCSPECATSYLFREQIDANIKFERYSLLNYLYCKIYDYKKNIKPAPNPYYTLSKYQGNLTIDEYRSLFNSERFIIIVDKPLSRNLPELHEDNEDFLFNNNDINNNLFTNNNIIQQSKSEILNSNFNL